MKKVIISTAVLAVAAAYANAAVIYDDMTGVTSYNVSTSAPGFLFGDGATAIASTGDPSAHWEITSIDFGMFFVGAQSYAAGQLVARIDVFSSYNPTGTPSVNGTLAGTAFYAFGAISSTANAAFGVPGGTLSTPIVLPSSANSLGWTVGFFDGVSGARISTVRAAITTSVAPTVGTSPAGFYRDADDNGIIDQTDARGFGNTVDNMIIRFNANAVPEPASVAIMGLGLVGLVARRRRSSK